jgi:hypothetical protein
MRRHFCLMLVVGTVVALAGPGLNSIVRAEDPWAGFYPSRSSPGTTVRAQNSPPGPNNPESWWQRFKRDYHRNNCWPEPFVADDRAAVNIPFQIQADNAWVMQNLLSDYHFVEGTSQLNSAGQYRVNWIVSRAPMQRKVAFIQRGSNDAVTTDRLIAVQNAIASLHPRGMVPVYESSMSPSDWAGSAADATLRAAEKTIPDPHLPKANPTAISN